MMEKSTRNLMIVYAVVVLLSLAGVALNIIPIFNLESLEDSNLSQEVSKQLTKGFAIIAFCYLIIALTALGAIIKSRYSKQLLIALILALISTFVFGPFIFDFLLEANVTNL